MRFSVFGARGFIGRNLCKYLSGHGHEVIEINRGDQEKDLDNLGHVIYAAGLTGDFRLHPNETIEAHVCNLVKCLQKYNFESWLYLSSTRVYRMSSHSTKESATLPIKADADGIYDISKLLGESYCMATACPDIRVARLSNVYGSDQGVSTFLGSIVRDIHEGKSIFIGEDPQSAKDYIAIEDVVELLVKIAGGGRDRIYNIASGRNIAHQTLIELLQEHSRANFTFKPNAPRRAFPVIDISRAVSEFGFTPRELASELGNLFTEI
ncbi:MAG: NAD-dependent epimerase/dehydratase family protein [Dehalococcoidia bacterium]|nr:NAD-dependent epimerase/dehydratase family protein [Dehalococcoidia bacterium]